MKILNRIRNIESINKLFRWLIKGDNTNKNSFIKKMEAHWRVTGVININMEHIETFKMFTKCDDTLVDDLFYSNFDEINEIQFFSKKCKNAEVILDVGSNTGLYSIVASKSNPKATIYAFEPYPANYERLKYNLELNQINNVNLIKKAVGSYKGSTLFYVPSGQSRISQVSSIDKRFSEAHLQNNISKYEEIEVPIISLDSYINESKIKKIDLIKIDVESLEFNVLQGSIESIKKHQPIILCEIIFSLENRIKMKKIIDSINYSINIVTDDGVFIKSEISKSHKRNYLLIPRNVKFLQKS